MKGHTLCFRSSLFSLIPASFCVMFLTGGYESIAADPGDVLDIAAIVAAAAASAPTAGDAPHAATGVAESFAGLMARQKQATAMAKKRTEKNRARNREFHA